MINLLRFWLHQGLWLATRALGVKIAPGIGGFAMKGWFGPRLGTNTGYDGVYKSYDVAPVTWQGWLIFLLYCAAQLAAAIWIGAVLQQLWWLLIIPLIHIAYLWVASRHFVGMAERDPSTLPSDLR